MATPVKSSPIWEEIELAESYLVCSMFEEASSSAFGVLKHLRSKECSDGVLEDIELNDMLESAGMVLVQSLKELGRTLEIKNKLMQLYGSLTAIPVEVFLAGVCFQMQEDPRGAKIFLEEFLSKWKIVNEQSYVPEEESLETNSTSYIMLGVDTYLQVVEAYITLMTGILIATDLAISWVEKAALPEDIRQQLLRRLQSMQSSKHMGSQASMSADGNVISSSVSFKKEAGKQLDGDDAAKQAILRYSRQHVSTFWWYQTINLKFGSIQFAVSNGSILLTALLLLAYYFIRRKKKYTITSILKGQALFVKKIAIDLWQLAFSYQVNPLAAVEPPLQNRISR